MSWLHNRTTIPTFLPPRPTITEIATIDIGACLQEYQILRGDIHECYSFQEYILKYGFRKKKENVNSLRKNQPTCEKSKDSSYTINEEVIHTFTNITWNMWKNFFYKGDENNLDTPLKE